LKARDYKGGISGFRQSPASRTCYFGLQQCLNPGRAVHTTKFSTCQASSLEEPTGKGRDDALQIMDKSHRLETEMLQKEEHRQTKCIHRFIFEIHLPTPCLFCAPIFITLVS
jgi:hypothetical protein